MKFTYTGRLLKQARLSKLLTVERAAMMLGVTPGTINVWESGDGRATPELSQRLCGMYGLSQADLDACSAHDFEQSRASFAAETDYEPDLEVARLKQLADQVPARYRPALIALLQSLLE